MSEIIEMDQNRREQAPGDISGTTGHTEMVHLSKFSAFYEAGRETNFMFEIH